MRLPIFFSLLFLSIANSQEAHMVVEAYSGKVLSATNSTQKRSVASLTKMATAIVAVDWANATGTDLGTYQITVTEHVLTIPSALNLQAGDRLTLRDALYASMLVSDNVAAFCIAESVGNQILRQRGQGGDPVAAFVNEMNHLAKAIYANQTKFVTPHGLETAKQSGFSTAADVARLSIHAMRRNAINFIARQKTRDISISGISGTRKLRLTNTNELIGEQGILGVKTGTTAASGPCLALCMDRDPVIRMKSDGSKGATPRRLIVVLLNSPNRFGRARQLLRSGWAAYDPWLTAGAPIKDPKREILSTPPPLK